MEPWRVWRARCASTRRAVWLLVAKLASREAFLLQTQTNHR
ncbi:hypothetical protein L917_03945 [Phytophthora nicotianae]|uniref:Uncharacterized protein n=1 Tax=Phytophthora nicotianae TaxID=4792 RepID=W2LRB6_PHYNI|nr:hypothetical protein L917_03945 [Phytophthora nicotianae]